MMSRRDFLRRSIIGSAAVGLAPLAGPGACSALPPAGPPRIVSTWNFGPKANSAGWDVLVHAGHALDAVEAGAKVVEADPEIHSVGYGGYPDREGRVTLDACVMDSDGEAGAVCFLEGFRHPLSIARKVMTETPHVMLAGAGAADFALAQGFASENLLTPDAETEWRSWMAAGSEYEFAPNAENHDTISLLALDAHGHLAGGCTTSGARFKMRGRVGDSPIIGSALFVDDKVGAACATGNGEEVIKTAGSALVVELMRGGATPREACHEAIERIVRRNPRWEKVQVGFLAMARGGEVGAYSVQPGFQFAVHDKDGGKLMDSPSRIPA